MTTASRTARELVERLLALGATEAVLSPGSRSGPLALALAAADQQGLLRLHVRVDEREAGFLALGMAKASRRVVPVVTTSGTAVANLHPAMLEAQHARVRLLAVTADRPGRLRGTGANQTTDQRRIFSGVAFVDRVDGVDLVDAPQHLNLELDEPLVADVAREFAVAPVETPDRPAPSPEPLTTGPRTVVVAGDDARQPARVLARDARWPLLAEPSSGSRNGEALVAHRLLLAHSPLVDRIERVVSMGHATLSRPVTRLLSRTDVEIVHVGDQSTFPVPAGPNVRFVDAVACERPDGEGWLEQWRAADTAACDAVDAVLRDREPDAGPYVVARAVNAAVPPGGLLFIGSSSPVRDLDLVARPYPVGERRLLIANRGLAGIDGTLSSAVGAALARPSPRAIAYVGDLTFLHGSNGLLIGAGEPRPDLTIVVVNDDGGSIFATLEQGAPEHATSFERVYATPTGADIGALCAGLGVPHRRLGPHDLAGALADDVTGIRVLEVPIDRTGRRDLTLAVDDAVARALAP